MARKYIVFFVVRIQFRKKITAEVAGLFLFPAPLFVFNWQRILALQLREPGFLLHYMLIKNFTEHERWNVKLSVVAKLLGESYGEAVFTSIVVSFLLLS